MGHHLRPDWIQDDIATDELAHVEAQIRLRRFEEQMADKIDVDIRYALGKGVGMSKATETAIKLLESLPEETQETLIEALRQLVQDAQDEAKWNQLFKNRDGLIAAARKARVDVAASKTTEMDYERL